MAKKKKTRRTHVPGPITMHHMGYTGVAYWDETLLSYNGEVIGMGENVVGYTSRTFPELSKAFHDAVEKYATPIKES